VQIRRHEIPEGWSIEAADFINKCLQRKPANRLGLNGPHEVKQHVWLKDFNWQALLDKKVVAPYQPEKNQENFDQKQANAADPWKDENVEQLKQNSLLLRRNSIQNLFSGYYFDYEVIKLQKEQEDKAKMSSMSNSSTGIGVSTNDSTKQSQSILSPDRSPLKTVKNSPLLLR
jgi:serine/threonine protein kinase